MDHALQKLRPMTRSIGLIGAAVAGGGAAYFLDPSYGRRRRNLARDQLRHGVRVAGEGLNAALVDLDAQVHGAVHELRAWLGEDAVDDDVVVERVRSRLGRVTRDARRIRASALDRRVVLTGPCREDEIERVVDAVRHVRGVRGIDNHLEAYVPLEPVHARPREHFWPPGTRLVVGAFGVIAIALGLAPLRRPRARAALVAVGSGLLVRTITNLDLRRITGIGAGRRAIDLEKTIHVEAPVEEVFAIWSNPEKFPLFMSHVDEVRKNPDGSFHWRVRGPARTAFEWDAIVTESIPNERIAWSSREGAEVKSSGTVRFERSGITRTTIHVELSYNPPGGAIGHAFAKLLGADPQKQMDDDLLRLKSLLERGRTTGHETVTLRDIESS